MYKQHENLSFAKTTKRSRMQLDWKIQLKTQNVNYSRHLCKLCWVVEVYEKVGIKLQQEAVFKTATFTKADGVTKHKQLCWYADPR